jgi:hypothetical protein
MSQTSSKDSPNNGVDSLYPVRKTFFGGAIIDESVLSFSHIQVLETDLKS